MQNNLGGSDPEEDTHNNGETLPLVAGGVQVNICLVCAGAFLTSGCLSWRETGFRTPAEKDEGKKQKKRKRTPQGGATILNFFFNSLGLAEDFLFGIFK